MQEVELQGRTDDHLDHPGLPKLAVVALAVLAALAVAGTALADPPPPPEGTFMQCTFDSGKNGGTFCITTTNTVDGPFCFDDASTVATYGSPIIVYNVTVVVSSQQYQGNVVAGDPVLDSTGAVSYYPEVKPHAKLVYDSGPHASFFRLVNTVDSC